MQLSQVEGQAPTTYFVELDAQALANGKSGKIKIEVHRDWAPKGADRFFQLVQAGFYDKAEVFRVVPNFVVQFGINSDPAIQQAYRGGSANIQDDPVKQSNKKGTITFATSGPNTRSTQIFINLNDNANLDSMGFSPFGRVVSDMSVVENCFAEYGETPDQSLIQSEGNQYLRQKFPKLTYFSGAKVVPSDNAPAVAGPAVPAAPALENTAPWHGE